MYSIKNASAAALTLVGLLAFTAVKAEEKTIAIVNGIPISEARLDYVVKAQVAQGQKDDANLRSSVKESLIMREILAQEAIKKGLDKNEEFAAQMEMAKQEFLIRAYFDDFIKQNPISDEEMKAEYERVKKEQLANSPGKEYKARHILIKDEKQAKAALAEVKKSKGKNFAAIAKKRSEDSGSKNDGGALDWSDGTNYIKEFADALVKLNKGEYTKELVKTQFGYHIIMMDDIRDIQFPAFEDVKERLYQQMLTQKRDATIAKLKEQARIE